MPIHVEVCVQYCFSESDEDDLAQLSNDTAENALPDSFAIAPEQWESWFQSWLETLAPDFSPIQAYELSLRLTNDHEIQALNAQYRHQDKPTDVLAFAALETDYPQADEFQLSQPLYLGDIIISMTTAEKQAHAQHHALETELAWLAAHGLLHLLGWDHPDDDRLTQMLKQQRFLLHTVGLSIGDS